MTYDEDRSEIIETLGLLLWVVSVLFATNAHPTPMTVGAIHEAVDEINEKLEMLGLEKLSMISPDGGRGRKVRPQLQVEDGGDRSGRGQPEG